MVFWLVYGGMAEIGMPGLFWAPDGWTTLRSALGVTLFMYWMLYLVFVRDFEVHSHEPDRQVWAQFPTCARRERPAGTSRAKPRPRRRGHSDSLVSRLRGAACALDAGHSGRPSRDAARRRSSTSSNGPGWPGWRSACSRSRVIVWTRVATRLHELWRQLICGKIDLRQIRDLDPNRLDPHANIKNILVIVVLIQADLVSRFLLRRPVDDVAFSARVLDLRDARRRGNLRDLPGHTFENDAYSRSSARSCCCSRSAGMLDYEVEISQPGRRGIPRPSEQLLQNLAARRVSPLVGSGAR